MVIDGSGFFFLGVVCIGVPALAFRSSQRLGGAPLPISRGQFFFQTIFMQILLFTVAVVAAVRNGIDLLAAPPSPLLAWGLAAAFLAVLLAVLRWRWPQRDREAKERLYRLLPHERRDLPMYFLVCLAAGICEETVYRGVATVLLTRVTGSLVPAVFIAAIVFALAHIIQGWRAVVAVFGIALMAHSLVLTTQSLFPAMAAHAIYDALAGVMIMRLHRREAESTVAAS